MNAAATVQDAWSLVETLRRVDRGQHECGGRRPGHIELSEMQANEEKASTKFEEDNAARCIPDKRGSLYGSEAEFLEKNAGTKLEEKDKHSPGTALTNEKVEKFINRIADLFIN